MWLFIFWSSTSVIRKKARIGLWDGNEGRPAFFTPVQTPVPGVEESRSTDTKRTDEDDVSMTEGPRKGPRKPNWADVVRGKKIK